MTVPVSMITPALIAGVVAPRRCICTSAVRHGPFGPRCSARRWSCATAQIVYSGPLKVYTSEVLVVLLLTVGVPSLARRSWNTTTAVAWFVGSMVLAWFSSFAMVATVAAAIVLVLHPRNDLRLRLAAVLHKRPASSFCSRL